MNKESKFWNENGDKIYYQDGVANDRYHNDSVSKCEFDILKDFNLKDKQVLEIGPGTGRDMTKFEKLGARLNAVDVAESFIDNLSKNKEGNFKVGDARKIEELFEASSIDVIYSRWSLIHLTLAEFGEFLNSTKTILKDNGFFMISIRYGHQWENIHKSTKMQSLQLDLRNVFSVLPEGLEITRSEIIDYSSTQEPDDKQINIVFTKLLDDRDRNNVYKEVK